METIRIFLIIISIIELLGAFGHYIKPRFIDGKIMPYGLGLFKNPNNNILYISASVGNMKILASSLLLLIAIKGSDEEVKIATMLLLITTMLYFIRMNKIIPSKTTTSMVSIIAISSIFMLMISI